MKYIIILMIMMTLILSACATTTDEPVVEEDEEIKLEKGECLCTQDARLFEAENLLFDEYGAMSYDSVDILDLTHYNFKVEEISKVDGVFKKEMKTYGVEIRLSLIEDCKKTFECEKIIIE